jgi:hypothetical protein
MMRSRDAPCGRVAQHVCMAVIHAPPSALIRRSPPTSVLAPIVGIVMLIAGVPLLLTVAMLPDSWSRPRAIPSGTATRQGQVMGSETRGPSHLNPADVDHRPSDADGLASASNGSAGTATRRRRRACAACACLDAERTLRTPAETAQLMLGLAPHAPGRADSDDRIASAMFDPALVPSSKSSRWMIGYELMLAASRCASPEGSHDGSGG